MGTIRFHDKNRSKGSLKAVKPTYRKYKTLFWIAFGIAILEAGVLILKVRGIV